MKNDIFFPILLLFAFLTSFLLQAGHSIEHVFFDQHENTCHRNKTKTAKNQITNSGEDIEQCCFCGLALSAFIAETFEVFTIINTLDNYIRSTFYKETYNTFYSGSLFALRAPPSLQ